MTQLPTKDQYLPRFNSIEDAGRFMRAAETDPSVSPSDYGAVPPFITQMGIRGLFFCMNPDYEAARYEMIFFVDRPSASQVEEMNKGQ